MALRNPATTASLPIMKRGKLQRTARARRPTAATRPCATVGAETSTLQAHAGEHRRRLVGGAAEIRIQPILPHFGSQPDVAVELVGHSDRGDEAIVEAPVAEIMVLAVTELHRADQPAAEGVIHLQRDVAA